jgi:predicted HD superfamily hydrolase involved in NAD metabolism
MLKYAEPYIPEWMKEGLKGLLNKKRYIHSLGAAGTAVYLAGKYGVSKKKAALAGFLHDCAKDLSRVEIKRIFKELGIVLDADAKRLPEIWHDYAGPHSARKIFKITDPEVLRAIQSHTNGRPGMSKLEKILFVADFAEPGREHKASKTTFSMVKNRRICLDELVVFVVKEKLNYLIAARKVIHGDAIKLWNELAVRI